MIESRTGMEDMLPGILRGLSVGMLTAGGAGILQGANAPVGADGSARPPAVEQASSMV